MIPKFNDLIEMATFLKYASDDIDFSDAIISFEVPKIALQKINEEVFYRNNTEGNPETNVDEVNLSIEGIRFRYYTNE